MESRDRRKDGWMDVWIESRDRRKAGWMDGWFDDVQVARRPNMCKEKLTPRPHLGRQVFLRCGTGTYCQIIKTNRLTDTGMHHVNFDGRRLTMCYGENFPRENCSIKWTVGNVYTCRGDKSVFFLSSFFISCQFGSISKTKEQYPTRETSSFSDDVC